MSFVVSFNVSASTMLFQPFHDVWGQGLATACNAVGFPTRPSLCVPMFSVCRSMFWMFCSWLDKSFSSARWIFCYFMLEVSVYKYSI